MTVEQKDSYSHEDLLACARGDLFGPGNAQLPMPPMLMIDRVVQIADTGGRHGKGLVVAEFDVRPNLWFFGCHFEGDPVMPGCLGLDAFWQMTGFFLGWSGAPGRGRAFGVGGVKLKEQVEPAAKLISYTVHIKRVVRRALSLAIADGEMMVDGQPAYEAEGLRVGVFTPADEN
jgi:3-hydroxyacyl-[acyl-carrier protein] dehydratase / trans-2-decenoyl-[acyl-carrier protein] isomerase